LAASIPDQPRGLCAVLTDTLYLRAFLTSLTQCAGGDDPVPADRLSHGAGLTRVSPGWRNILLMLVILPFWTSFLLRVYAWMGLMGRNSWFNGC
jgi:putrescine transport system permease protein